MFVGVRMRWTQYQKETGSWFEWPIFSEMIDCMGRISSYIHVSLCLLQALDHALDDLVYVPYAGEFFAECTFPRFFCVISRLARGRIGP